MYHVFTTRDLAKSFIRATTWRNGRPSFVRVLSFVPAIFYVITRTSFLDHVLFSILYVHFVSSSFLT